MTGAIISIDSLERWFKFNDLPYFTVKYAGSGERIIARNDAIDDVPTAWDELKHIVESQAEAGRSLLEVMVYNKGKNNHALRTNVDIRPSQYPVPGGGGSGIAGFPAVGNVADYINMQVKMAMLERDNEDLQNQINSPTGTFERIIDRISESPHLSGLAQTFMIGLFSKNNPQLAQMMRAVNGTPAAMAPGAAPDTDDDHDAPAEDPQLAFTQSIQSACATLGTDPLTLAKKIAQLAASNPDMAKTLLQS